MRIILLALLLIIVAMMTGCADAENIQSSLTGHTYGFWGGLWHGLIAFFSFIGSLFSDEITVYAVNNNGGWYDFGFCWGIGALSGGSSSAVSRRKNK